MSSSTGFLDFFILEANEYVEELDGLLGRAGVGGPRPDADAVQRVARALRGSATMARLTPFADLAAAIERIGRALQTGALGWQPGLAGALVAAVDDLKTLLRSVRGWTAAEDRRASERVAELSRYAPPREAQSGGRPETANQFLATEASNIAAGLELLTTRPADSTTASNVLGRVRALRGVAGVREIASLADVLEATEEAARPLELRGEASDPHAAALLNAAADLLRQIATALRTGSDPNASSPELDRFLEAQDRWSERTDERDRIVPIAQLFYADGSAGVVEPAPHPPTTMSERFRLELVSQGEHLRAVAAAARSTPSEMPSARSRRELRRALRSLQATAESFGESSVAAAIAEVSDLADHGGKSSLGTLDRVAAALALPKADGPALAAQLRAALAEREPEPELRVAPEPMPQATPEHVPVLAPTPWPEPTPAPIPEPRPQPVDRPPMSEPSLSWPSPLSSEPIRPAHTATPAGSTSRADDLLAALDSSIAALHELASRPISEPVPIIEEQLVPIESLLYRGRSALDRAVEIRDQLRRGGPTSDPAALEELFDLVELARAE